MQSAPTQFPFSHVYFGLQPFGIRVHCTLDPSLIKKQAQITGLAIEATGGMQPYFGYGPFVKNSIRALGQTLGGHLGTFDRDGGTSVIYWGTNDTTTIQPLGFRPTEQWRNYSFSPPTSGYGRNNCILTAIKHFLESEFRADRTIKRDNALPGVFVFLLDGPVDDFNAVLDYLIKFAEDVIAHRRMLDHLIFVGMGEQILESIQGQIQAFAATSGRTDPPLITSLIVRNISDVAADVEEAIMACVSATKPGKVFEGKGQEICKFPSGLPGAFQFYLSGGSKSFLVDIDGAIYKQELIF
jgi:hypothetical protein